MMAVNNVAQGTVLSIKVQTGTNASGSPTYKSLHFSGVKASATDADLYAIASSLGGLQTKLVFAIERIDTGSLVNA